MSTTIERSMRAKNEDGRGYESKLPEARQRFLAHVIEHGLGHGRRTPEDFIRHFPPDAIMRGLRDQPQLRANILVIATGTRSKIALKKSAESCGLDLQIALDEEETDAETIVQLFDGDDRVRYLNDQALWSYVTEGAFWQADAAKERDKHQVAAAHIAFMIDRALKDKLLTHKEVIEGITVAKLAQLLPRTELEKILATALSAGHDKKPYVEEDLLSVAPPALITQHVPLAWIWEHVIEPRIAVAHGFVRKVDVGIPAAGLPASTPPKPRPEPAAEPEVEVTREEIPTVPPAAAEAAAAADLDLAVDDVLSSLDLGGDEPKTGSVGKPKPKR